MYKKRKFIKLYEEDETTPGGGNSPQKDIFNTYYNKCSTTSHSYVQGAVNANGGGNGGFAQQNFVVHTNQFGSRSPMNQLKKTEMNSEFDKMKFSSTVNLAEMRRDFQSQQQFGQGDRRNINAFDANTDLQQMQYTQVRSHSTQMRGFDNQQQQQQFGMYDQSKMCMHCQQMRPNHNNLGTVFEQVIEQQNENSMYDGGPLQNSPLKDTPDANTQRQANIAINVVQTDLTDINGPTPGQPLQKQPFHQQENLPTKDGQPIFQCADCEFCKAKALNALQPVVRAQSVQQRTTTTVLNTETQQQFNGLPPAKRLGPGNNGGIPNDNLRTSQIETRIKKIGTDVVVSQPGPYDNGLPKVELYDYNGQKQSGKCTQCKHCQENQTPDGNPMNKISNNNRPSHLGLNNLDQNGVRKYSSQQNLNQYQPPGQEQQIYIQNQQQEQIAFPTQPDEQHHCCHCVNHGGSKTQQQNYRQSTLSNEHLKSMGSNQRQTPSSQQLKGSKQSYGQQPSNQARPSGQPTGGVATETNMQYNSYNARGSVAAFDDPMRGGAKPPGQFYGQQQETNYQMREEFEQNNNNNNNNQYAGQRNPPYQDGGNQREYNAEYNQNYQQYPPGGNGGSGNYQEMQTLEMQRQKSSKQQEVERQQDQQRKQEQEKQKELQRQETIRKEKERQERLRLQREKEERDRLEREKLEREKLEKERLEKEKQAQLERERLERERLQREKDELDRLAREKAEREKQQLAFSERERIELQKQQERQRLDLQRQQDIQQKELLKQQELKKQELARLEQERLQKLKQDLDKEKENQERQLEQKRQQEMLTFQQKMNGGYPGAQNGQPNGQGNGGNYQNTKVTNKYSSTYQGNVNGAGGQGETDNGANCNCPECRGDRMKQGNEYPRATLDLYNDPQFQNDFLSESGYDDLKGLELSKIQNTPGGPFQSQHLGLHKQNQGDINGQTKTGFENDRQHVNRPQNNHGRNHQIYDNNAQKRLHPNYQSQGAYPLPSQTDQYKQNAPQANNRMNTEQSPIPKQDQQREKDQLVTPGWESLNQATTEYNSQIIIQMKELKYMLKQHNVTQVNLSQLDFVIHHFFDELDSQFLIDFFLKIKEVVKGKSNPMDMQVLLVLSLLKQRQLDQQQTPGEPVQMPIATQASAQEMRGPPQTVSPQSQQQQSYKGYQNTSPISQNRPQQQQQQQQYGIGYLNTDNSPNGNGNGNGNGYGNYQGQNRNASPINQNYNNGRQQQPNNNNPINNLQIPPSQSQQQRQNVYQNMQQNQPRSQSSNTYQQPYYASQSNLQFPQNNNGFLKTQEQERPSKNVQFAQGLNIYKKMMTLDEVDELETPDQQVQIHYGKVNKQSQQSYSNKGGATNSLPQTGRPQLTERVMGQSSGQGSQNTLNNPTQQQQNYQQNAQALQQRDLFTPDGSSKAVTQKLDLPIVQVNLGPPEFTQAMNQARKESIPDQNRIQQQQQEQRPSVGAVPLQLKKEPSAISQVNEGVTPKANMGGYNGQSSSSKKLDEVEERRRKEEEEKKRDTFYGILDEVAMSQYKGNKHVESIDRLNLYEKATQLKMGQDEYRPFIEKEIQIWLDYVKKNPLDYQKRFGRDIFKDGKRLQMSSMMRRTQIEIIKEKEDEDEVVDGAGGEEKNKKMRRTDLNMPNGAILGQQ